MHAYMPTQARVRRKRTHVCRHAHAHKCGCVHLLLGHNHDNICARASMSACTDIHAHASMCVDVCIMRADTWSGCVQKCNHPFVN